jgi:hypothetical protein
MDCEIYNIILVANIKHNSASVIKICLRNRLSRAQSITSTRLITVIEIGYNESDILRTGRPRFGLQQEQRVSSSLSRPGKLRYLTSFLFNPLQEQNMIYSFMNTAASQFMCSIIAIKCILHIGWSYCPVLKLSLCFKWAPLHEGVLGEWKYSSTHSLISALDESEWSASRPCRFTPRERAPGTHWIGGWVSPRAVLDSVVKRKIPSPHRESNPRAPTIQPVAQRCTDWAVIVLIYQLTFGKSYNAYLDGR